MSIEQDLQTKLDNSQHHVFITEADELLAAWMYKRCHTSHRSMNLNAVPATWRLSTPPNDSAPVIPCHVTTRHTAGKMITGIVPPGSTINCHGHGAATRASGDFIPLVDSPLEGIHYLKDKSRYVSPIMDSLTLRRVQKELGLVGRAVSKTIKGRQYIALTGYAGLRELLKGTTYKPTNPKIIKMGIGKLGRQKMVKGGLLLSLGLSVSLNVAEHFTSDKSCCYQLFGNIGYDMAMAGVGAAVFYGVTFGVAALGAPVFVTLAAGAVASFFFTDLIDDALANFKIKQKIIAGIKGVREGTIQHDGQMRYYTSTGPVAIRHTGRTGLYGGI